MVSYYRLDGGYVAVTDESPAGFEGMVFVGRGGPIDNIQDMLFTRDQLNDPVNVADVPPSWCTALGYHVVEDFPMLDAAGENLEAEIPVRVPVVERIQPRRPTPQPKQSWLHYFVFGDKDVQKQIGYLLGLVVLAVIFLWW